MCFSTRRNASAAVDRPTAKETKGRKAKPKTFVPFFSESEEYNSDKENFVPDTTDTPGLPDLKVLQSRNILRPPKSIPHAQVWFCYKHVCLHLCLSFCSVNLYKCCSSKKYGTVGLIILKTAIAVLVL